MYSSFPVEPMAFEKLQSNNPKLIVCLLCLMTCNVILPADSSYCTEPVNILQNIETSCFVALASQTCRRENFTKSTPVEPEEADTESSSSSRIFHILFNTSFKGEPSVKFGIIDIESFLWSNGELLRSKQNDKILEDDVLIFPAVKRDRTCLLTGSVKEISPKPVLFKGVTSLSTLTSFVNDICNVYRTESGLLSISGLHRQDILKERFHVSNISDIRSKDVFMINEKLYNTSREDCHIWEESDTVSSISTCTCKSGVVSSDGDVKCEKDDQHLYKVGKGDTQNIRSIPQCQRIAMPTREEFFHNFLKISRPVVIDNAIKEWPAIMKWTNDYLREKYGENEVHIKLTPGGEYEGVESVTLWESHSAFKIPEQVKKMLPYPDLVVVRPATARLNFSEFLDIVERVSSGQLQSISAYLEYSSIPEHLPELENDILKMDFVQGILEQKHLNIWLSDGNTLGKLHFDPFDNLLCQISGKKEVILFEPHNNTQLYESHIPEAMLSYNKKSGEFRRQTLLESTSMVMSPVDIKRPDYQRFPEFANTYPLNCTISEGDVLFMPSFWWHEVQSYPSKETKRNLAVNFWYEPFLTKEFPCPECSLDINPKYRHLL